MSQLLCENSCTPFEADVCDADEVDEDNVDDACDVDEVDIGNVDEKDTGEI